MFSSLNSDGQSSSSPPGHGVAPPGLQTQDSSWIGLLSVVSRPALSFLQRYLPGRAQNPVQMSSDFVDAEREFLSQLDDMMPLTQHAAPHLAYLGCRHDGAGRLEPKTGRTLPWLTADSLQELGIQSAEELELNLCQDPQTGSGSSVRTFLRQVRFSSGTSQDIRPSGGNDWLTARAKTRTWWGSFWGSEESSQRGPLSWSEDGTLTGRLCPQQQPAETKAHVLVQRWTLGENTGPPHHKQDHNGGLRTVQNRGGSTADQRLSRTSDQDNGYSSLEEEHVQMLKVSSEDPPQQDPHPSEPRALTREEEEEEEESTSAGGGEQEEEQVQQDEEEEVAVQEGQCSGGAVLSTPQCQNKTIAFIMGCPCSDDDSSQSESSDDDDDDGFDSEGSSDSSDEDEDEDEEGGSDSGGSDSEAERLWNSLCRSLDPYDPRNFTAHLHTGATAPVSIPAAAAATPPSSAQSTPDPSPPLASPPSGQDSWDDSTSASEADEAESLRLWSSFSSSDPYSPFNFQAPLRTQGPPQAGPPQAGPPRTRTRTKKAPQTPPLTPRHTPASPPEYRKEEAEERLDSGFSEPPTSSSSSTSTSSSSTSSQTCSSIKKVRFRDDVEEFFASCGEEEEDRRGPWEELARDRCRFLRRCQEVEQSIAYCLQPQHRSLVYRRRVLHVQDA